MIVNLKLKQILKDKGMTQKELAELHGSMYGTFKNKMSRNTMKFAEVEKLADELGCDIVFIDRETKKVY